MAASIMKDDGFLRSEGLDNGDLTVPEMQLALIRRGFNPMVFPKAHVISSQQSKVGSGDKDSMGGATSSSSSTSSSAASSAAAVITQGKIALTSWSQIYDTVTPVAIQTHGNSIALAPPSHSYILHASCLQELLPELSPWRQGEIQRQQQQRNTISTTATAKTSK